VTVPTATAIATAATTITLTTLTTAATFITTLHDRKNKMITAHPAAASDTAVLVRAIHHHLGRRISWHRGFRQLRHHLVSVLLVMPSVLGSLPHEHTLVHTAVRVALVCGGGRDIGW